MANVTVSVDLPVDRETVWNDVAQLETHVDWMADAESIEFQTEHRTGNGVVMRVLTKVGPIRTADIIRVVSWDPPHSIGVIHEGLVTGRGEFRLDTIDDGTRFTWEEQLRLPWFLGGPLGSVVARPILAWVWRRNLRRLAKRFA